MRRSASPPTKIVQAPEAPPFKPGPFWIASTHSGVIRSITGIDLDCKERADIVLNAFSADAILGDTDSRNPWVEQQRLLEMRTSLVAAMKIMGWES